MNIDIVARINLYNLSERAAAELKQRILEEFTSETDALRAAVEFLEEDEIWSVEGDFDEDADPYYTGSVWLEVDGQLVYPDPYLEEEEE